MAYTEYTKGKLEKVSWVAETSYGSGGTIGSGEVVGRNVIIEPDEDQGYQETATAGGSTLYLEGLDASDENYLFGMTFTPVNWKWLKYIYTCADADDSGVKTHTFTEPTTIQSFICERAFQKSGTDVVHTYTGSFVTRAEMNWQRSTGPGREGFINVALSCVAQDRTDGSTVAGTSAITKKGFQYRMAKLTINSVEYKEMTSGNMIIDTGIDPQEYRYCSSSLSSLIGEPSPQFYRVTGRFTVKAKNAALYVLYLARTAVGGTNTLLFDRDGTGNDQILFTFGDFYILNANTRSNLEGTNDIEIAWESIGMGSIVARDDITTY